MIYEFDQCFRDGWGHFLLDEVLPIKVFYALFFEKGGYEFRNGLVSLAN